MEGGERAATAEIQSSEAGPTSAIASGLETLSLGADQEQQDGTQGLPAGAIPGDAAAAAGAVAAAAGPSTPEYSVPGKPHGDEVKKQLFPVAGGSRSPGSPGGDGEGSGSLDGGAEGSSSVQSLVNSHGEATSRESAQSPVSPGSARRSLELTIEPTRQPNPVKDHAAAVAAIGMSPGARTFAPPFGARFGDRNCDPGRQQRKTKGMERVREEDEGEGESSGEPSPDGAAPPRAGPVSPMPGSVSPMPGAAVFPGGLFETSQKGSLSPMRGSVFPVPGPAGHQALVPSFHDEPTHAPRVASTTFTASAAQETASRPRFRMAFEGNRDEASLPSESSKFAPTPRVRPRDGLPWAKSDST